MAAMTYMPEYGSNPEIVIPYIDMEVLAAIAGHHCRATEKVP